MIFASACGLVVIALWNGVRVMSGNTSLDRSSKVHLQAPTKFHAERDSLSRKDRSRKDPVVTFFERAKQGMTEQEIRGIIAEFEVMKTMPISGEVVELQEYTKMLNEWRLNALAEALSLSREQKREVLDSLNPVTVSQPLEWSASVPADNIELLLLSPQLNSYAASWSLCNLTEDQVKLTYKTSLQARYAARWEEDKKSGSISCHGEHLLIMHDTEKGEYIDYPPSSPMNMACTPIGSLPGGILDVTNTFPLTPDQKLENHRYDFFAQAKLLHPSQLRMALLINPGVIYAIKHDLDKPSE